MKKQNKIIIALAAVIVVLTGVMIGIHYASQPETAEGAKTVEVEVVFADESTKEHTIYTDAEFLRGALEEEGMVKGDESEFGLFVKEVDGVTVDDAKQEWWCFTQDGEFLNTGIDTTPIADGDHFEITLKAGY